MPKQQYMVIERLKDAEAVYTRLWDRGRMAPTDLVFESTWVDENVNCVYRLLAANDRQPIDDWMANWKDLIDFEVHSVITPEEAGEKVAARLKARRAAAAGTQS
jgi:hypothetical protein